MLEESPVNPSDGSSDGTNDVPPVGALIGDSLEGITSGSFRRLSLVKCLNLHLELQKMSKLGLMMELS